MALLPDGNYYSFNWVMRDMALLPKNAIRGLFLASFAAICIFFSCREKDTRGRSLAGDANDHEFGLNTGTGAEDNPSISRQRRMRELGSDGKASSGGRMLDETAIVTEVNKRMRDLDSHSTTAEFYALINAFPSFEDATVTIRQKMMDVAIVVCANDSLAIERRMDLAWDMLPVECSPNAIDDAIRFATSDDLPLVDKWLRTKPAGEARTKLFRLVAARMERLEVEREVIEKWISTLEYTEERDAATRVLDDGL